MNSYTNSATQYFQKHCNEKANMKEELIKKGSTKITFFVKTVVDSDIRKNIWVHSINTRLRDWCHHHNFSFLVRGWDTRHQVC